MGFPSLPWFRCLEPIAASQSPAYALGRGGFDSLSGDTPITSIGGARMIGFRSYVASTGHGVTSVPAGRQFVYGFLHVTDGDNTASLRVGFFSGGTLDFNLNFLGTGGLQIRRGGTTLETVSTIDFGNGTLRYVQVAVDITNAGSYEVRVGPDVVAQASGVDLTVSDADIDQVRHDAAGAGNLRRSYIGHEYLKAWDGAGDPGFYGQIVPYDRRALADVATQWTPDMGTDHAARINEAAIDDDGSYLHSSTPGEVDEFTQEDTPSEVVAILAVMPYAVGKAPAGGFPAVQVGQKNGTSELYSPDIGLDAGYKLHTDVQLTQPDLSALAGADFDATNLLLKKSV